MEHFDDKNLHTHRVTAPDNMYSQVRSRIVQERIQIAKTRRQLAIGSALLLIVGVVNVAIIVFSNREKPQTTKGNTEKMLYETYFDNNTPSLK